MYICKFCGKECKNGRSLGNHETRCPKNPDRKIQVSGTEGKERARLASINRIWTQELREQHSKAMKSAVLRNPDSYTSSNVCGRVKIKEYNGTKFHGEWEVLVAKWFDENNIKWERDVTPISYFWNNGWHLYFPDFYLPNLDILVEVKGYETERDRCKWSVVPNLIVLKNKEIKLIKENKFVLITH